VVGHTVWRGTGRNFQVLDPFASFALCQLLEECGGGSLGSLRWWHQDNTTMTAALRVDMHSSVAFLAETLQLPADRSPI